jgi:hypothetical protein
MELFGLIAGFLWIVVCMAVSIIRLNRQVDAKPGLLFYGYIWLSFLLGTSLLVSSMILLHHCNSPMIILVWIPRIWLLAWSPTSLLVSFFCPRQLLDLPFGIIAVCAFFSMCTALAINDNQSDPDWMYWGFLSIGLFLLIHSAITFYRASKIISESQV